MADIYKYALGRRKTSVATVRLYKGKGKSIVNDKPFEDYFPLKNIQADILLPLTIDKDNPYYFTSVTKGGGTTGQADSIKLALTRALILENADLKSDLKQLGLTTRDDRKVERKKTGLLKARKKSQFSKR